MSIWIVEALLSALGTALDHDQTIAIHYVPLVAVIICAEADDEQREQGLMCIGVQSGLVA